MNPELKQFMRDKWDSEMVAALAHHDQASARTDDMLSNMTEENFKESLAIIHATANLYAESPSMRDQLVGLCIGRGLKQMVESLVRRAMDDDE